MYWSWFSFNCSSSLYQSLFLNASHFYKLHYIKGFNVRSISDFTSDRYHQSVLMQAVPVPGFLALQNLLSFHASSEPVLKLLLQFLVGQYDSSPSLPKVSHSSSLLLAQHDEIVVSDLCTFNHTFFLFNFINFKFNLIIWSCFGQKTTKYGHIIKQPLVFI